MCCFFVFLASLAAPKYDSVRSLYMKDGSLDIFFQPIHPIIPSTHPFISCYFLDPKVGHLRFLASVIFGDHTDISQ
jgi:hypothetical protein